MTEKCRIYGCSEDCAYGDRFFYNLHRLRWRVKCSNVFGVDKMANAVNIETLFNVFVGGGIE